MVDFLGRGDLTGPPALLAQWVGGDIAVTNPLPCAAIAPLAGRVALVFIVMRRDDFLVFLTIEPGGQAWAAGIGTRSLGFVWHKLPPPSGYKESLRRFSCEGRCIFSLLLL